MMSRKVVRCAIGWLAVNFFLVLPLCAFMCIKAIRVVTITAVSPEATTVQIGEYATDPTGARAPRYDKLVHFVGRDGCVQAESCYFPNDIPLRDIALNIEGAGAKRFVLRELSVNYAGVFKRTLDLSLWPQETKWISHGLCLPAKFWKLVAAAEILLLLFSLAAAYLFKVDPVKKSLGLSALVSGLFAVFVCVVVPYQSVCANHALFGYALSDFFLQSFGFALAVFAGLTLGLVVLQKNFGYLFHAVIIGVLVYEYLNTGILAAHEPPINGETIYYTNRILFRRDLYLIVGIIGFLVALYRWLKPYYRWIACALAVMIGASLFDVRTENTSVGEHTVLEQGFCSKMEAAQNTVWSTRRNVMMFVLDSITTEVAMEICRDNPEIRNGLTGFTLYANHVGQYPCTHFAVAGFMTTNMYFGAERTVEGQAFSAGWFGKDSVLLPYFQSKMPAYCITGHAMNAFGWPRAGSVPTDDGAKKTPSVFFDRPEGALSFTLFETVRFRLTPFIGKLKMLIYTFAGTKNHGRIEDEVSLYAILKHAKLSDAANTLAVFHTHGGHGPYCVDRAGNAIKPRYEYKGFLDQSYYAMSELVSLFAVMRQKGVYDNTTIIVIADHGSTKTSRAVRADDPPGLAFPMCLVKPAHATGGYRIDEKSPTTHCNLAKLVMDLRERELSLDQITQILSSDERIFLRTDYESYEGWKFDQDGHGRKYLQFP